MNNWNKTPLLPPLPSPSGPKCSKKEPPNPSPKSPTNKSLFTLPSTKSTLNPNSNCLTSAKSHKYGAVSHQEFAKPQLWNKITLNAILTVRAICSEVILNAKANLFMAYRYSKSCPSLCNSDNLQTHPKTHRNHLSLIFNSRKFHNFSHN